MAKSFNPKNPDKGKGPALTPSDPKDPTKVIVGKESMGKNIDSFEEIFTKAIGQAIYGGDICTTGTDVTKLKAITGKGKNIADMISNISEFYEDIKKDVKENIEKLPKFFEQINDIKENFKNLIDNGLPEDDKDEEEGELDKNKLELILGGDNLSEVFTAMKELKGSEEVKTLANLFEKFNEKPESGNSGEKLTEVLKGVKGSDKEIDSIKGLLGEFEKSSGKSKDIEKTNKSIADLISSVKDAKGGGTGLLKTVKNIALAAVGMIEIGKSEKAISKGSKAAKKMADEAVGVQDSMSKVDDAKTQKAKLSMEGIAKLVAVSAMVLIIGAFIVMYKPEIIKGAIMFTAMLSMFIFAVLMAVIIPWKASGKKAMGDLVQVGKFVAICGLVLIVGGSILTLWPNLIGGAILFTMILSLFIASVTLAVVLPWRASGKQAMGDLVQVGKFVAICAIVLLVGGSILTLWPNLIGGAILFTIMLSLFIASVTLAVVLPWRAAGKQAMGDLGQVAKFVVACSIVLLAGGTLLLFFPQLIQGAIMFTIMLSIFIASVTLAVVIPWRLAGKKAMGDLKQVAIFVAVSAIVMLAGAYFLLGNPQLAMGALGFTALLFMFVLGMSLAMLPMAMFGKHMGNLRHFALAVAVCALVMLVGAYFIISNPMLIIGALGFTALLFMFVMGMNIAMLPMAITGWLAKDNLKNFAIAVAVCALVMLIGAYFIITNPMLILGALAFTVLLFFFVMGMNIAMLPMAITGFLAKKNLLYFSVAVAACAFVMLIGAYFIISNPMLIIGALAFTILLTLFVLGMNIAMLPMSITGFLAKKNLLYFTIAVIGCGIAMLGGAWFLMKYPMLTVWSMMFTGLLFAFVLGMNAAMLPMSLTGILAQKNLKYFAIAVAASAAVMLAGGGLLMKFPMLTVWCVVFAIELSIFVGMLMYALTGVVPPGLKAGAGKGRLGNLLSVNGIKDALNKTWDMAKDLWKMRVNAAILKGVVLYSGLILLAGGGLLMKYPMLTVWVATFGALLISFITLFMRVVKRVNEKEKDITKAVPIFKRMEMCLVVAVAMLAAIAGIMLYADPVKTTIGCALVAGITFEMVALVIWVSKQEKDINKAVTAMNKLYIFAGIVIGMFEAIALTTLFADMDKTQKGAIILAEIALIIVGSAIAVNREKKDIDGAVKAVNNLFIFAGTLVAVFEAIAATTLFADMGETKKGAHILAEIALIIVGSAIVVNREKKDINGAVQAVNKLSIFGGTMVAIFEAVAAATVFADMGKTAIATQLLAEIIVIVVGSAIVVNKQKKDINGAVNPMNKLSIFAGTMAGVLYLLAEASRKADMVKLLEVTGIMLAIMGITISIAKLVAKAAKDINKSLMPMVELGLFIDTLAAATFVLANALGIVNPSTLLEGVGVLALMMVIVGGIAFGLGMLDLSLSMVGGIKTVAAVMIVLGGAVAAFALSMVGIAHAMKIIASIPPIDITVVLNNISCIVLMAAALIPLGLPMTMAVISMASISVTAMSVCLSIIGAAVQSMASLTIPVYEGTKVVGVRKLQKSDFDEAAKNTKTIVSTLGKAIIELYDENPEIFKMTPTGIFSMDSKFGIVVQSTMKLGKLIATIAKAVHTFATLKIPKYSGTKVVGYDKMQYEDFVKAAISVKTIVITLGKALIEVYEENPDVFAQNSGDLLSKITGPDPGKTPIAMVMSMALKLGHLISTIAIGVQCMGSLKIPTKWNKDGKPIDFRQMTTEEIIAAGENTKNIVVSLMQALIDIYNENPEMFTSSKDLVTAVTGPNPDKTPMAIVLSNALKVGKLISSVAEGVSAMATLQVPTEWNKDGKPIKFKSLKSRDILKAGDNTKEIVVTIMEALIDVYQDNPDMFTVAGKSLMSMVTGPDPGSTPIAIVLSTALKVGELISSVAEGVKKLAAGEVPIEWDKKNGKPIKFRTLNSKDCSMAADGVAEIVTTIMGALTEVYNNDPTMFEQPEGGFFSGPGESPIQKVISTAFTIGEIVGKIGETVANVAALQIPTEWDKKTGKPIQFRTMNGKDFEMVTENVTALITCMAEGLMNVYHIEGMKEMFEQPEQDGLMGMLGMRGDSPMAKVVTVCHDIAEIVGMVGTAVKDIAMVQIPTAWDPKTGKPTKYRGMTEDDFDLASTNITALITCMAKGLLEVYQVDGMAEMFEEPEQDGLMGMLGIRGESKMSKIVTVARDISEVVAMVGKAVGDISSLLIPTEWDETGNPKNWRTLDKSDFTNASTNITELVTTMAKGLYDVYSGECKELFEEVPEGGLLGWITGATESKMTKIIRSIGGMGELVRNIAEGVQLYAQMLVPDDWDAAGQPIHFTPMTPTDLTMAAFNIGLVITCVGSTLSNLYESHPEMFQQEYDEDGNPVGETPFAAVSKSCVNMGLAIKNIADGVKEFATIYDTVLPSGRKIDASDFVNAGVNIGMVVTCIGTALVNTFHKHKSLFENPPIITTEEKKGFLGIGGSKTTTVTPDPSDPPLVKVCKACMLMGDIICSIAEGISYFAVIDEMGVWSALQNKRVPIDYEKAALNIRNIISLLGNALTEVATNGPYRNTSMIENLIHAIDSAMSPVMKMADLLGMVGVGKIPVTQHLLTVGDVEIKATKYVDLNDELLKNASDLIKKILTTVGAGIVDAWKGDQPIIGIGYSPKQMWEEIAKGDIFKAIEEAINLVSRSAVPLLDLACGVLETEDYTYTFTDESWGEAADVIKTVLTTVAQGIGSAMKSASSWLGNDVNILIDDQNKRRQAAKAVTEMIDNVAHAIQQIGQNAYYLAKLGSDKMPIFIEGSNGELKIIDYITVDQNTYPNAANRIKTVLTTVAQGLAEAIKAFPESDVLNGNGEKTKKVIDNVEYAIVRMSDQMYKLAQLGLGNAIDEKGNITLSGITLQLLDAATQKIGFTLTSIARALSEGYAAMDAAGALDTELATSVAKVGFHNISATQTTSKIGRMISAISMAMNVLNSICETLAIYSTGKFVKVLADGKVTPGGTINFDTALPNIYKALTSPAHALSEAHKTLEAIGLDDIKNLINKLSMMDNGLMKPVENVVMKLAKLAIPLMTLNSVKLAKTLVPIISDMATILQQINGLDEFIKGDASVSDRIMDSISGLFSGKSEKTGKGGGRTSGFDQFIISANAIIKTALFSKMVDVKSSFDDLNYAIASTSETLQGFYMPEDFPEQVKSLDKFIHSINQIKIQGADALTRLLEQLNKLGINMGNVDKLAHAITDNLSKALTGLNKAIDEINKTMIEDAKRKEQHKKEIKNSVKEVQTLMNQEFVVIVKPDQSGSSSTSTSSTDSENSAGSGDPKALNK